MAPAQSPPTNRVIGQRFAIQFSYPVAFVHDLFAADNEALSRAIRRREPARRHRVLLVVDDGVTRAWPQLPGRAQAWFCARDDALELVEPPHVMRGGESAKNDPAFVADLHARFAAAHLDRQSFVVAVGGGAMLDAVGYAAATAHRGLRLVRAPSTVLAQCDAGIGVKNGVNAFGAKNFLGAFAPPWAVINDDVLLSSLEPRDRRAGIAEAIKVALVQDADFFYWMTEHVAELKATEPTVMDTMIHRCAELHLRHTRTSGDPFEYGSARPLDFGHWAAHKLETMSQHALRHGEAVAIGLALDVRLSESTGRLDADAADRAFRLIGQVGLPTWHKTLAQKDESGRYVVLDGLDDFREHIGGQLTITLLSAIGKGVEVHEIDHADVTRCIDRLYATGATDAMR